MLKVIFLTLSLFLVSCALRPIPITHVYTVDTDHNVCGKYEIVNSSTMEVKVPGDDLPLTFCNGHIAVSKEEYLAFKSWLKDAMDRLKKKAGRAKLEVYSQDLKQDFQQIEDIE